MTSTEGEQARDQAEGAARVPAIDRGVAAEPAGLSSGAHPSARRSLRHGHLHSKPAAFPRAGSNGGRWHAARSGHVVRIGQVAREKADLRSVSGNDVISGDSSQKRNTSSREYRYVTPCLSTGAWIYGRRAHRHRLCRSAGIFRERTTPLQDRVKVPEAPAMTSSAYSRWVAIVDDEAPVREALLDLLEEAGFAAHVFASGEEFLASGQHHECSCMIADIRMPGMSGLDLQARLNAEGVSIPIIFITAHGDERLRMQALRSGAVEFLSKPFDDDVIREMVRAALDR
jgi:CheY-like chemotaxis protein